MGLWVSEGAKGVKNLSISNMSDEQNRLQVKFHQSGKLVTLGEEKRSNIDKFQLQSQFQRFLYQTVCVSVVTNKR